MFGDGANDNSSPLAYVVLGLGLLAGAGIARLASDYGFPVGASVCFLGTLGVVFLFQRPLTRQLSTLGHASLNRQANSLVVDTSAIIDGRIFTLQEHGLLGYDLVLVPETFQELQQLADHGNDDQRRASRRGLNLCARAQRLRLARVIDSTVSSSTTPTDEVLVGIATERGWGLVTCDGPLEQIALAHGLRVLNPHRLSIAVLHAEVLPGEDVSVQISRPGQQPSQGVGYLDDGTLVVVENGASHIGEKQVVTIVNILDRSDGRILFGRIPSTIPSGESAGTS